VSERVLRPSNAKKVIYGHKKIIELGEIKHIMDIWIIDIQQYCVFCKYIQPIERLTMAGMLCCYLSCIEDFVFSFTGN